MGVGWQGVGLGLALQSKRRDLDPEMAIPRGEAVENITGETMDPLRGFHHCFGLGRKALLVRSLLPQPSFRRHRGFFLGSGLVFFEVFLVVVFHIICVWWLLQRQAAIL